MPSRAGPAVRARAQPLPCKRRMSPSSGRAGGGVQFEPWWIELMDNIEQRFRTMSESEVDWTE